MLISPQNLHHYVPRDYSMIETWKEFPKQMKDTQRTALPSANLFGAQFSSQKMG
jgi:hypothetical protein